VDRDKAALLGVGISDVGKTLETLLGSRKVTTFKLDGDQYDVILQLEDDGRRTPEQLQQIYVRNSQGQMLPLSSVLTIKETVSPAELTHFNKLRSAKITASLAEGYTLGQAVTFMQKR
jgi:multidrug efflux pump